MRTGRPPKPPIERFCPKILFDETMDCWNWTGLLDKDGYGRFRMPHRWMRAHRFAYEFFRDPIPSGLQLDHLCRNRSCCNPWHLEPVTNLENTLRSPIAPAAINGRKFYCKRGHPLSGENLYRNSKGERQCRICDRKRRKIRRRKAVNLFDRLV
jgi:hypothetical protein